MTTKMDVSERLVALADAMQWNLAGVVWLNVDGRAGQLAGDGAVFSGPRVPKHVYVKRHVSPDGDVFTFTGTQKDVTILLDRLRLPRGLRGLMIANVEFTPPLLERLLDQLQPGASMPLVGCSAPWRRVRYPEGTTLAPLFEDEPLPEGVCAGLARDGVPAHFAPVKMLLAVP